MTLHNKIAARRKAIGLTQEKLGMLLGVSPQAVSKWENAECLPDLALLPQLCASLRISADELLDIPPLPAREGIAKACAGEFSLRCPTGIQLSAQGEAAVQSILQADPMPLQSLLAQMTTGNALTILRALAFSAADEPTLIARCNLAPDALHSALFPLLAAELVQCTPEGYALGPNIHQALAALTAAWLVGPQGQSEIRTITVSYTS